MKKININKNLYKIIAAGLTSFVLLTNGCSSKTNEATTSNEVTTEVENNNEQEETKTETNTNEKNKEEFDNFQSEKEEIDSLLYTENFEKAKEVWNDYFIDAVDFIFYDKEYKDTKFSELNPEAQQKCINTINELGNKMNEIFPNWQEDLGNIKDSTAEAYYNILANIKNLIGEDNYNNIKDLKDGLKSGASQIGNSIKDAANNWYQGYKSRNK